MRKQVNTTLLGAIVLGIFAVSMTVHSILAFALVDTLWLVIGLGEFATAIYLAFEAAKWVRTRKKVTNFLIDTPAAPLSMTFVSGTSLLDDYQTTGTTSVLDWVSGAIWVSLLVLAVVTAKRNPARTESEPVTTV